MLNTVRALLSLILLLLAGCVGPMMQSPEPQGEPGEWVAARNPAVGGLIAHAGLADHTGELQGATASAERGLRIDRREPAVYLLLARSYLELAQPRRADEFARQGLRFTTPGTVLYDALETIRLESSQNNAPTLTF